MEDQPESSGGNGADPASDPAPDPVPGPAGEALGAGAQGAQAALPLFYKDPQPLHTARHAGKGLRRHCGSYSDCWMTGHFWLR